MPELYLQWSPATARPRDESHVDGTVQAIRATQRLHSLRRIAMEPAIIATFSSPSPSPHKLFQSLWRAVEARNGAVALRLVDALLDVLGGNQTLATSAVRELVATARRRECPIEIVDALTRLPGFRAD